MKVYDQYVEDVLSGKIKVGYYVKLACQRYKDFKEKYEFREAAIDRVINFISKLRHYTGSHNGKPFILLPYQQFIVAVIFGFYHKGTNKRVTNYVYLELARKNGKTAFMAAICLYMLIADGESGSEVELVANSAKQAKICFNMCSAFLESIDTKGKYFKRYRDSIKFDKTKSLLQVLSSDASGNDGYNSYCFLLDECHEQPDSRLWDVMTSSQGMRVNSLAMIATTAGFNRFGFCYPYRDTCINILKGTVENDAQAAFIYCLDDDDDWEDPEKWAKANPSIGITVQEDYLQQQVKNAKANTSLEVGIRTKNLNEWTNSSSVWIAQQILLQSSKKIDLNKFQECYGYGGVDLASVSDLTAFSVMIPYEGKYYFKTHYYLPSSALHDNVNSTLYQNWHRQGYLTITDGNVTDYDYVLNDIVRVNNKVLLSNIAYDQYNATQWATDCVNAGISIKPYSQALYNFNKPSKEFERLIKRGQVVIDDNPITRWCFDNVVLKFDHNENCKPCKEEDMKKIDGVIAMLEALGLYLDTIHYDNEI